MYKPLFCVRPVWTLQRERLGAKAPQGADRARQPAERHGARRGAEAKLHPAGTGKKAPAIFQLLRGGYPIRILCTDSGAAEALLKLATEGLQ